MKEWGENHQNDAVFFTNSGKDPFIILVQPFSSTTPKTIKKSDSTSFLLSSS